MHLTEDDLTQSKTKKTIPDIFVEMPDDRRISNSMFRTMLPRMKLYSGVKSAVEVANILNAEGYKINAQRVRILFYNEGLKLVRKRRWKVAPDHYPVNPKTGRKCL